MSTYLTRCVNCGNPTEDRWAEPHTALPVFPGTQTRSGDQSTFTAWDRCFPCLETALRQIKGA